MPRLDELLTSVRDFLHADVMNETSGRINFLARVAGNSLDVVQRELTIGPQLLRQEHRRLEALLEQEGTVDELRWELVRTLRDGSMDIARLDLHEYLRETVVNQVGIDQPKYSGFQFATESSHEG
jgi:hypothetical protein